MVLCYLFFFFKQKTAYEMRISDWSSDVCSSDLIQGEIAFSRGCRPDKLPGLMDPSLIRHMPDPFVMVDMERAAKRLASAIKDNETILVFGDYDVDGATSAAILRRFLKMEIGRAHV